MAETKLWFCFRGPYECLAYAGLKDRAWVVDRFKSDEVIKKVLEKHPDFKQLRVEINCGVNDEDGRIYAWGYDEPGSDEGPDTQHEGTAIWINDELVYNDNRFVDTETEGHDPEDCEVCSQPMA